jgi:hypothetical protein
MIVDVVDHLVLLLLTPDIHVVSAAVPNIADGLDELALEAVGVKNEGAAINVFGQVVVVTLP